MKLAYYTCLLALLSVLLLLPLILGAYFLSATFIGDIGTGIVLVAGSAFGVLLVMKGLEHLWLPALGWAEGVRSHLEKQMRRRRNRLLRQINIIKRAAEVPSAHVLTRGDEPLALLFWLNTLSATSSRVVRKFSYGLMYASASFVFGYYVWRMIFGQGRIKFINDVLLNGIFNFFVVLAMGLSLLVVLAVIYCLFTVFSAIFGYLMVASGWSVGTGYVWDHLNIDFHLHEQAPGDVAEVFNVSPKGREQFRHNKLVEDGEIAMGAALWIKNVLARA